ncbi:hypothetical protein [Pseudanabaena yagii]|uniref:Uncharacterized protein n=1 Tax=Pseudanabaena yagii GIHE-NHR1 TaxID=2722753 RepID=A0ABX1LZE4_9CYAN|nr:hypothetical protein [Pseudanabaena yagii]NMF60084.1 hypothetical protein [Pseudanabaena yagii GIHE-NHR1]
MQSDAFPTPPIYSHHFQPRLLPDHLEQDQSEQDSDHHMTHLLSEIETLMTECSSEESKSFWTATNRIKIKHQVMESMQKIENLFLDLAKESTQDPELISAVAEGLLYTNSAQNNAPNNSFPQLEIPKFLKQQAC